jgi:signal transduction histidine kinase
MREHPLADDPSTEPLVVALDATPSDSSPADALLHAAHRLLEEWRVDQGAEAEESEVRDELTSLLQELTAPPAAEPVPPDPHSAALRRRLLDVLRSALVDVWSEADHPPPAEEMLAMLRAFEEARQNSDGGSEPGVVSRLTGPEGLDLVVEVAHDLRSPLTSILFLAETLRRGQSGEINDVQRRQLGIIYSAALGLISVASDMIELARGGTQLMEAEPSPFSVAGVLESVRDIVQPMAEEKGLTMRILAPDCDQRLGYPVALSRVLLNLTSNALKFTEEGLIELTVTERPGDMIEFAVRDTGRGLDAEALETLFQPFRRSRARRRHAFSGSGLGLMISRRLVNAMGAELQIETRADWGTRFHFELALAPVPAS